MTRKTRRKFTPEFKREVVEQCHRGDRSTGAEGTMNQHVTIFYFDVIGLVEEYTSTPDALDRLRKFQRSVRDTPRAIGALGTQVLTVADNVWARIANEPYPLGLVLDLAVTSMSSAQDHGFRNFFGACTAGPLPRDVEDGVLVAGEERTDIRLQHIDSTSIPHMRAAVAEKWSAKLASMRNPPFQPNCVWVADDLADRKELCTLSGAHGYQVAGNTFDLDCYSLCGSKWPFPGEGRFTPISLPFSRRPVGTAR